MLQPSIELTKQTIGASLPSAGGSAEVFLATGFVPCCGLILFPAGVIGIAYLIVPKLGIYPTPETKNSLALNTVLGLGITSTLALTLATLLTRLIVFDRAQPQHYH